MFMTIDLKKNRVLNMFRIGSIFISFYIFIFLYPYGIDARAIMKLFDFSHNVNSCLYYENRERSLRVHTTSEDFIQTPDRMMVTYYFVLYIFSSVCLFVCLSISNFKLFSYFYTLRQSHLISL